MTKKTDKPMMPSVADRDSWPNPATRSFPPRCTNLLCEEIRSAYAKAQGAQPQPDTLGELLADRMQP